MGFVTTAALCACLLSGHPGHATFAEAEVNPQAGTLEVSLCVDSFDLERALAWRFDDPPELEDKDAVAPLLARYLRETIFLRTREGGPGRLEFVGHELEGIDAWLYFEIVLPKQGRTLEISNQMLFESCPGQAHRMQLRALDGQRCLLFNSETPWHRIEDLAWRSDQELRTVSRSATPDAERCTPLRTTVTGQFALVPLEQHVRRGQPHRATAPRMRIDDTRTRSAGRPSRPMAL